MDTTKQTHITVRESYVIEVIEGLRKAREEWRYKEHRLTEAGGRAYPSPNVLRKFTQDLKAILFPMRLGPADLKQESEDFFVGYTLDITLSLLQEQIRLELALQDQHRHQREALHNTHSPQELVSAFALQLPTIRRTLDSDVRAAYRGDPAAQSIDEVLLCYPGIQAIIHHRLAHALYSLGLPTIARIISEQAHEKTGIDIHPGAQIGGSFFIDHGTGVVIGETAIIGERVRIYQAVTLGAKRFSEIDDGSLEKGQPRHPIIENDVVIYAGATLLGRITIGRSSSIGGNVWLTRSVPAGSWITQANAQHGGRSAYESTTTEEV